LIFSEISSVSEEEVEITAFRSERMPDFPVFYTALNASFGFLYGSIYTLLDRADRAQEIR
jgi:hypothetical protein